VLPDELIEFDQPVGDFRGIRLHQIQKCLCVSASYAHVYQGAPSTPRKGGRSKTWLAVRVKQKSKRS
jgi:hypothetical protein